jgi:AraC-like DNA-binding protein
MLNEGVSKLLVNRQYYNLDDLSIRTVHPSILLNLAEEFGGDRNKLLTLAGISKRTIASSTARISARQYIALIEQTMQATKSPGLGELHGRLIDVTATGQMASLVLCCATFGEAAFYAQKYIRLSGVVFDFESQLSNDLNHIHLINRFPVDHKTQRFLIESWITSWLSHSQFMLGTDFHFATIKVTYPKPKHSTFYNDILVKQIEFNADYNEVAYDDRYNSIKLRSSNKHSKRLLIKACSEELEKLQQLESISSRVADAIMTTNNMSSTINDIATLLNIAPRTLGKKLAHGGTTFQKILNEVRRCKALTYIKNQEMTICDIAAELGFSDTSNFRRAFKSWTGKPPSFFSQIAQ